MTWFTMIYSLLTSLLKKCSAKNKEIDTKAPCFLGSSGATSSRKPSISSPTNQTGVCDPPSGFSKHPVLTFTKELIIVLQPLITCLNPQLVRDLYTWIPSAYPVQSTKTMNIVECCWMNEWMNDTIDKCNKRYIQSSPIGRQMKEQLILLLGWH